MLGRIDDRWSLKYFILFITPYLLATVYMQVSSIWSLPTSLVRASLSSGPRKAPVRKFRAQKQ